MAYYINHSADGKILGFAEAATDINTEVSNAQWVEAQRFNKIVIVDNVVSFENADWRTAAQIAEDALRTKWADINSQIANLKIGYLDGNTFVAKFGYEIDGYTTDDTNLYDVSNLPIAQISVGAHVYNASAEGLRAMIEQAAILATDITINWYEDWQTFAADKVCLDVVAARAREEHQLIRDTVMGV